MTLSALLLEILGVDFIRFFDKHTRTHRGEQRENERKTSSINEHVDSITREGERVRIVDDEEEGGRREIQMARKYKQTKPIARIENK